MDKTLIDNEAILKQVRAFADQVTQKQKDSGFTATHLHIYTDKDGKFIYAKPRLKNLDTGDKYIRSISQDNAGKWQMKDPDFDIVYPEGGGKKPLYLCHDLTLNLSSDVYIFEGEQKADLASKLGFIATTSGGSTQIDKYHWEPLAGRTVYLWADCDEAGAKWLTALYCVLTAFDCNVRVIDVDGLGLPEKGDIVDWVAMQKQQDAAVTDEQLIQAIKKLPILADEQLVLLSDDIAEPSSDSIAVNYPEWHDDPQLNAPMIHEDGRFELYHDGLFFVKYNLDDPANVTFKFKSFVCSPLEVMAMVRDGNSGNWGKLLQWRDADNVLHKWSMPMALLQGDAKEYRRELAAQGLNITANSKQRGYLDTYIQNYPVQQRARCVDKLGWDGEQYILPDGAIGGDDKELVIYQSAHAINSTLSQQGTLAKWRDELCKPLAEQSRFVFSIACAFAGQLLEPLGSDGGGFHIKGSSTMGKSLSLKVAASVWGKPDSYTKTWRSTDNALEGTASEYNDSFLPLDEISEGNPTILGNIIYMLGNGTGKGRSTTTGHNRTAKTWRIIFLSNGEKTVEQEMAQAGKKTNAGVEVRVAHIDADAGNDLRMFDSLVMATTGAAQADKLNELSQAYYGVAGMAWLEHITTDKAATTATAKQLIDDFMSQYSDLAAQAHRVAKRFAIVAAAGEMATGADITGWQAGQASTAVRVCLDNWLDNYGRDGEHEQRQIIKHIQAFIELHGSSRFQPLRDSVFTDNEHRVNNRVGYRNYDTDEFYFLSSAFSKEVCPPYDMKKVVQVLDEAGLLSKNEPNKKTLRITLPNSKTRSRIYAVKGEILSYETDKTTGTARTQGTAHIQHGLGGAPRQNDPSGQRGHSEQQGGEVSALSATPKSRGTAVSPVTTRDVPLSALSAVKKQSTENDFIGKPDDEIPPFGRSAECF